MGGIEQFSLKGLIPGNSGSPADLDEQPNVAFRMVLMSIDVLQPNLEQAAHEGKRPDGKLGAKWQAPAPGTPSGNAEQSSSLSPGEKILAENWHWRRTYPSEWKAGRAAAERAFGTGAFGGLSEDEFMAKADRAFQEALGGLARKQRRGGGAQGYESGFRFTLSMLWAGMGSTVEMLDSEGDR